MRNFENEALIKFREKEMLPAIIMAIQKTYDYCSENEEQVHQNIYLQLDHFFESIVEKQSQGELKEISYIDINLSRINIVNKKYTYPVRLYGENWYLEPFGEMKNINVNFIYEYFNETLNGLLQELKKYVNKISVPEAEQEMYKYVFAFNNILVRLFKDLYEKIQGNPNFSKIAKNAKFNFNILELYEIPSRIITLRNERLTLFQIKKMIDSDIGDCEDLKNSRLEKIDFINKSLVYTDFSNSVVNNANFNKCNMEGVRLCNCTINNSSFSQCFLNEADFKKADLEAVVFEYCHFESLDILENDIKCYQYKEACLEGTSIKNVEFKFSSLKRVDFTKPTLETILFKDSDLEDCMFLKEQLSNIQFINCNGEPKIIK